MKIGLLLIFTVLFLPVFSQERNPGGTGITDTVSNSLSEVVVTGEYQPQSLRNSVYRTRVINKERIRLRAATNIQQVLNTELGFRFSNDLTVGTSDVQLMGMSGRNVKILLDGVAMIDRSDTRESLNQIDVNTIERIEIVEGPLSVSYGTDALAGVINIITKRAGQELYSFNARMQEETVGDEYSPFTKKGTHLQNIGGSWQSKGWNAIAGFTHADFSGFNAAGPLATITELAADNNRWKPKEQWLGNGRIGYGNTKLNVWYRLDYVNEDIYSKGAYNPNNYKSTNQRYITNRYNHQLQGEYRFNSQWQLSGFIASSSLKRQTRTLIHDYSTGTDELSAAAGTQDVSRFDADALRATLQYKMSDRVSFQPGMEISLDAASGARIKGSPAINDYAFFVSSELRLLDAIIIRPGIRLIHNSVYEAPPVIPSLNAKFRLNTYLDLRMGYASGFRAPALRELYYDFFDASHSIIGNENLKAEQSDSYTASLAFNKPATERIDFRSVLSGFYNKFKNRIDYGLDISNPTVTTLINISRYKTTGGTLENTLSLSNLQFSLGFSYIGTYNEYAEDAAQYGESKEFVWTPEVNSNVTYTWARLGATVNLAYKFTGKTPFYQLQAENGSEKVRLERTASFSTADLMLSKKLGGLLTLNGGVKNLFDVTTLASTAVATGGAHSTGGPIPLNYGRSYVLGLSVNLTKN